MKNLHHNKQLPGQLNAVRDAQKRVSRKIRAIQSQLKMLENVSQSKPWVSFGRVNSDFEKKPDIKNFSRLLNAKARNQMLGVEFDEKPENWKGASPGTVHNVIKRDYLSAISKKYYGDPGFWNIIYLENLPAIGNNPEALKVGLKLNIP